MDEENVHEVPRGLTLDQAQFLGFHQGQDELSARLDKLTQVVERMALARATVPSAHRVPRRNVQVEDDADWEDELPDEEEQPVPRQEQRGVGNNLKLKIPQFKGTSSPEEYLEWVQRVDKVFEYYEYSETQKCQFAALEFTDYANLWWENIKARRRRDGENEIRSWWEMKRLMHRRFVPKYYKQQLYLQLQSIRQCGMSIEDYVKEFKLLTVGSELRESQETTIARFLGGLNKGIADMFERKPFVSLEYVIKLVIKVRRQRKHGQLTTPRVFNLKPVIAGSTPQGSLKDIKCLEFHGFRHFTSEFSNWREVTIQNPHLVESEVEEAILDVCGVTSEEKVKYADEGEKLKVQPVVSSELKLEEQWECLENISKVLISNSPKQVLEEPILSSAQEELQEEFAIEDLSMVFHQVKPAQWIGPRIVTTSSRGRVRVMRNPLNMMA
ncbi:hypothetical protein CRG98_023454 [Punica granatum]|uniref:Retrotransposon gag domain-containing protein n=1 Tax=Punica granatum TaxID=22663 RepID=A0A2I0JIR5_PUNGR|nr:hypothetical protein CRG98_023454 [Punica granatum]